MYNKNENSIFSDNIKHLLYFLVYCVFLITLFLLFAINLAKTNSPTATTENDTISVSSFNSNNITLETGINDYVSNLFSSRNSAFLDGNIESLTNFYNINHSNSKYSLNHELRRISYLRDWAIERGIIFTSINSSIHLKNIQDLGDKITLKIDELCSFNYIYYDDKSENKFEVSLIHIFTLNKIDGTYQVEKDYYLDFLSNASNIFPYRLNNNILVLNKSFDNSFIINSDFNIGDILTYTKFNFVDHRGVVCDFDSKGYPLINSTTINSSSLPYDLGWKDKNIFKEEK